MAISRDHFMLPPKPDFNIQTRDEEGGLQNWHDFADAMTYANRHKSVWKISWALVTGERCRLIRRIPNWFARLFWGETEQWVYEPIMLPLRRSVPIGSHGRGG